VYFNDNVLQICDAQLAVWVDGQEIRSGTPARADRVEAEFLNEAGALHRAGGDLRQARACHQQALGLARQIGSAWDEAHALAGLGRCALAAGHTGQAADELRQALEIFQRIGAAEAARLSAELHALTDSRSAAHGS